MPKVVVGMSGGVDSSVAAYLLKQQGFDVEGVSFKIWEARCRTHATACCAEEAALSAAATAEKLGISHRSVDVRTQFMETVIEPFAHAYASGRTPNPCILCNRHVKFPLLIREADLCGAEHIATGHYARIVRQPEGGRLFLLRRGSDRNKDQSYVLYVLTQEILSRLLLPLGAMTKSEVRDIARRLGLPAADRPESQEICFVENNDYAAFLEQLEPGLAAPGPIRNGSGAVIGTHRGLFRYTIGQRRGLGVSSPAPLYVISLDPAANTLFVGARDEALVREFVANDLNWIVPVPGESFGAEVKVRSMMEPRAARVHVEGEHARVIFHDPQWAPAPGQSAVFYDGETVLGGGTISRLSENSTRSP